MTTTDTARLLALMRDRGAARCTAALDSESLGRVEEAVAQLPSNVPGVRIGAAPALADMLAATGAIGTFAAVVLGGGVRPVRAVLFDKSEATNWALGWHQDRTIVVERRIDTPGFGPWSTKAGLIQVEPPFALLNRMMTVRVHLDPVDDDNAPLRIVPGSHRLGRIGEQDIASVVDRLGEATCLAARGDIWCYATPIVHGSRAAARPRRRRVLQVDYSADVLPAPLQWRGL